MSRGLATQPSVGLLVQKVSGGCHVTIAHVCVELVRALSFDELAVETGDVAHGYILGALSGAVPAYHHIFWKIICINGSKNWKLHAGSTIQIITLITPPQ